MQCNRCREEVNKEDSYAYLGEILCEDCYIAALAPPRSCDPAAVSSATTTRRQMGQSGTQGLTALQSDIYLYVREKGKTTREELLEKFNIAPRELESQFAVLRHCELLTGRKEGNAVYITTWSQPGEESR